ncbi:MAG: type II toxin-antitoxin system Phd/YefM family antitoxin [Nitrosomonas sp.]|jgi:prevent-host-death family protein|nr:type II toxin-antitoxin system Phd/YefM family antitoxin [Nitrosomonas sp.]MBP9101003.1 type II toxin-antitoxin system Phd/YefM family antitoxin [Nitrosomonas sp.]
MLTINIHEAKTHLSRFIEKAAAGEEIIIAKAGKPVAKLVPLHDAPSARSLGIFKGKLNVLEDFDAALPDEVLLQFQNADIEPSPGNR